VNYAMNKTAVTSPELAPPAGAQQRPLSIFLFFLCVFSVQRTLMQIRAVALAAFVLALVCRAMMGVAGLAET
jgi:hypothetical protein